MNNRRQKSGLYYPIKSKETRERKGAEREIGKHFKAVFSLFQKEEKQTKMSSIHSKINHKAYLISAGYTFQDHNIKFPLLEAFHHLYLKLIFSYSWLISTRAALEIRMERTRYKMTFVHQKWSRTPKCSHTHIYSRHTGRGHLTIHTDEAFTRTCCRILGQQGLNWPTGQKTSPWKSHLVYTKHLLDSATRVSLI